MFSSFAPERFFNIGGPDSLNDFSASPLCEVGKHKFCFVVHIVSEAPLKEVNIKHLFVVESCSPKLEQTFFTGMGKIDCRAGGDAFFCLFFFPLRAQHAVSKGCLLGHLSRFSILYGLSGVFDASQICKVY